MTWTDHDDYEQSLADHHALLTERAPITRRPIFPFATGVVHASPDALHRAAVEHYVMIVKVGGTADAVLECEPVEIAYEIEEAWTHLWHRLHTRTPHIGLDMDRLMREARDVKMRLRFGVK